MILDNKTNRPRIKIRLTIFDWIAEIIAFSFLIVLIALPVIYFEKLPDTIPIHFNAAGAPDGYGSNSSLWFLPVTALFMYLLMSVVQFFPQIYNYPVEITPENAPVQYRIATRLIRILKTVILVIFSFISFQTIKTATVGAAGLGKAFLPVFLLITFGVIIYYIVQSLNNRHKNSF
jgi:uncharacterized membrane protein